MERRVIFMGSIFKRGKKFWIEYYRDGEMYQNDAYLLLISS
jgi:hypothetical protein